MACGPPSSSLCRSTAGSSQLTKSLPRTGTNASRVTSRRPAMSRGARLGMTDSPTVQEATSLVSPSQRAGNPRATTRQPRRLMRTRGATVGPALLAQLKPDSEGELRRARKVRVHGVLARLPERRRVDHAVVRAVVRMVKHVEHLRDPGDLDGAQLDVLRQAHVHFVERVALEPVARRDRARGDGRGAVEPIDDRCRNGERGAAVVTV